MDPGTIAELVKAGGLALYCVAITLAVVALWRRVTALQDKLVECGLSSAKEALEMQAETLKALSAMNSTLQTTNSTLAVMERRG